MTTVPATKLLEKLEERVFLHVFVRQPMRVRATVGLPVNGIHILYYTGVWRRENMCSVREDE